MDFLCAAWRLKDYADPGNDILKRGRFPKPHRQSKGASKPNRKVAWVPVSTFYLSERPAAPHLDRLIVMTYMLLLQLRTGLRSLRSFYSTVRRLVRLFLGLGRLGAGVDVLLWSLAVV